MSKESFYFSHDYDAQNDPKIQALISEYKGEGYGIYWSIIEMLHKEETHYLPLKKYVFIAIAKQMIASTEQVEAIINSCINDFELLTKDGEKFTSKRVLSNFIKRDEISRKRSEAAKIGNEKRWGIANAKQKIANGRKGKEKKEKEKNIIIPTVNEFELYFSENGFTKELARKAYKHYDVAGWKDTNGKPVLSWKQKVNTVWFKDENRAKDNSNRWI